jgi:quinohemoprotein ethanol dehydrogenase
LKSPRRVREVGFIGAALLAVAISCGRAQAAPGMEPVGNHVLSDEQDGRNWAAYGRTFSESRFSPLTLINTGNVARLGLAWTLDLDVSNSLTSPLAVDGVLYVAAGLSIVHAVDARTGRLLWRFDPKVAAAAGAKLRVGWGIRGLAYWNDKVYVGTQDGRLLAIYAATGRLAWSVLTVDPKNGLFISGAPRVFNGKVVIGNAGGDFAPVRGYVTAYDAESGRQLWRFFVVPGAPGKADGAASDSAMEMAARTWSGQWWKVGGGGTVWNAMTYDPELNRLYLGTGNGGPWNWKIRSPAGGDDLFLASIVAIDADTGRYVWHYQETPGDSWDYDASIDMTLATISIDGKSRKVILQAPKNGFFYVIDRSTGRLISAEKLGKVTWAERIDLASGRPVEAPNARYQSGEALLWPSFEGLHTWTPQSYSPITGLVYVPTLDMPVVYGDRGVDPKSWAPVPYTPAYSGLAVGTSDVPSDVGKSILKAWDPRTQREVWSVTTPGVSNGGTVATAGGLVFQGLADGWLHAYAADTGKSLWSYFGGTAVTGAPITYAVQGTQYVSITAGPLNGSSGGFGSVSAQFGWDAHLHPRRLLTFVLDGKAMLPPTPPPLRAKPLEGGEAPLDAAAVEIGSRAYVRCVICHGPGVVAGGTAPDLRASPVPLSPGAFATIVRQGSLQDRGMPVFAELTDPELEGLRAYIRSQARDSLKKASAPAETSKH